MLNHLMALSEAHNLSEVKMYNKNMKINMKKMLLEVFAGLLVVVLLNSGISERGGERVAGGIKTMTSTLGEGVVTDFCNIPGNEGAQCEAYYPLIPPYYFCGACVRTSEIGQDYTAVCQTNSEPYIDFDATCGKEASIEILGNPEKAWDIYYLQIAPWTAYQGFYFSNGFNTHFIDGGRCGNYTPPPEGNRMETPVKDLKCSIINSNLASGVSQQIQKNYNCAQLKINETAVNSSGSPMFNESELPKKIPTEQCDGCDSIFIAEDTGRIEGNCIGQNTKNGSISESFTVCPSGKRDLGTLSIDAYGEGNTSSPGSATFLINHPQIDSVISPNIDYCGYPQKYMSQSASGKGIGLETVKNHLLRIAAEFSCNKINITILNEIKLSEGPLSTVGSMRIQGKNISYSASITYAKQFTCGVNNTCTKTEKITVSCEREMSQREAIARLKASDDYIRTINRSFSLSIPIIKSLKMDDVYEEQLADKFSYDCCPI